jgi:hypothetical protein
VLVDWLQSIAPNHTEQIKTRPRVRYRYKPANIRMTRAIPTVAGIGPQLPPPNQSNSEGIPETDQPSLSSFATPLAIASIPSVAMKGVTPKRAISVPFSRPTTKAAPRPAPTAAKIPSSIIAMAPMVLASPIVAATEMSKPPEIKAKLWPIATTASVPPCRAMFSTFRQVAKRSGYRALKIAPTKAMPIRSCTWTESMVNRSNLDLLPGRFSVS